MHPLVLLGPQARRALVASSARAGKAGSTHERIPSKPPEGVSSGACGTEAIGTKARPDKMETKANPYSNVCIELRSDLLPVPALFATGLR